MLFLLDVGSAMSFSAKGQLPEWVTILAANGNNATTARAKSNTHAQRSYLRSRGKTRCRLSRCRIQSGKRLGLQQQYRGKPGLLLLHRSGQTVFFDVSTGCKGQQRHSSLLCCQDLMPNDSRLYKLKLVFWRLLQENSLFDSLRFGMATTYQDEGTGSMQADFYKVAPWGTRNSK